MVSSTVDPLVPVPARVRQVSRETQDTFTLRLDASVWPQGFAFLPGQFTMLYAFGVGEVPISISGDPAKPQELVHTVRAVGAVTRAITRLRRGDALGVRGPYGRPWPLAEAKGADVLVVAGGLGLAPLRPAICQLLRQRRDYGRVSLLVGARTPEDLLFRREIERWQRRQDLQVLVTVDRAAREWKGRVGVVTALLPEAEIDPARTVALVCGPEVMMRFTVRELNGLGVPDERIYLSLERNMKCAVGHCGHCQYRESFLCTDGPVLCFDSLRPLFFLREV